MSAVKNPRTEVERTALEYLSRSSAWVPNKELAAHCKAGRQHMLQHMGDAIRQSLVEYRGGCGRPVYWRMATKSRFSVKWPPGFVSQWDAVIASERART